MFNSSRSLWVNSLLWAISVATLNTFTRFHFDSISNVIFNLFTRQNSQRIFNQTRTNHNRTKIAKSQNFELNRTFSKKKLQRNNHLNNIVTSSQRSLIEDRIFDFFASDWSSKKRWKEERRKISDEEKNESGEKIDRLVSEMELLAFDRGAGVNFWQLFIQEWIENVL